MGFFRKRRDLQPWLDYFKMLQEYERKHYLEVTADKHEAYVTRTALHAMAEGDDPRLQLAGPIQKTFRRIRFYAGWKSLHGGDYMRHPFALHVVGDDYPHDLLYTMVSTVRRPWWRLWTRTDAIDVIDYGQR